MRQLGVAHEIGFKIWRLSRRLRLALSIGVLVVFGSLFYSWAQWSDLEIPTPTVGKLFMILVLLALVKFGLPLFRHWRFRKTLQDVVSASEWPRSASLRHASIRISSTNCFLWQGRLREESAAPAAIAPDGLQTQSD
jgi:hypothetical protein